MKTINKNAPTLLDRLTPKGIIRATLFVNGICPRCQNRKIKKRRWRKQGFRDQGWREYTCLCCNDYGCITEDEYNQIKTRKHDKLRTE